MTSPANEGSSDLKRNVILGLRRVDWSDVARQNEFVNSVVSALNAIGEKVDYDYVCAVSGSAFRATMKPIAGLLWTASTGVLPSSRSKASFSMLMLV